MMVACVMALAVLMVVSHVRAQTSIDISEPCPASFASTEGLARTSVALSLSDVDIFHQRIDVSDTDATLAAVRFRLVASVTRGYVGLGIGNAGFGGATMAGTDFILAEVDSNEIVVRDQYGIANAPPLDDQIPSLRDILACVSNGMLMFEFVRDAQTNDFRDVPVLGVDDRYSVAVSTVVGGAHGVNDRVSFTLTLGEGGVVATGRGPYFVHGVLLGIAWMLLAPISSVLGRWFKYWKQWFKLHRAMFILATILTLVGVGLAVIESGTLYRSDSSPATRAHGAMGTLLFIATALQSLLGWVADKLWVPTREKTPFFPDILHAILGWVFCAVGIANVALGVFINEGELPGDDTFATVAVAVFWILVFGQVLVTRRRQDLIQKSMLKGDVRVTRRSEADDGMPGTAGGEAGTGLDDQDASKDSTSSLPTGAVEGGPREQIYKADASQLLNAGNNAALSSLGEFVELDEAADQ